MSRYGFISHFFKAIEYKYTIQELILLILTVSQFIVIIWKTRRVFRRYLFYITKIDINNETRDKGL